MGTESIASMDRNPKDIRQKILNYQTLFRTCSYKRFETIFNASLNGFRLRFFMPTIRGAEKGSKKRYAGLLYNEEQENELYFVGMESSRRDWTLLAKEFQADLFTLLFDNDNDSELPDKLSEIVRSRYSQLINGEYNDKLVYTKGLHKRLEDYTKNVSPHVRAARMLDQLDKWIVEYVMTKAGPEPVQKRSGVDFDYAHYSEKQLAPIADTVLCFFGMNYHSLINNNQQMALF